MNAAICNVLDLEDFVPFRLWLLSGRMTKAVGRIYAERYGISAGEWRALAVLGRGGPMTFNELHERAAMDKVRVSRTITTLMRKHYIAREVDPFDRRRIALALTDSGQEVYKAIVPHVLSVERDILASLTGEERTTLGKLISKGKLIFKLEDKMGAVTPAHNDED